MNKPKSTAKYSKLLSDFLDKHYSKLVNSSTLSEIEHLFFTHLGVSDSNFLNHAFLSPDLENLNLMFYYAMENHPKKTETLFQEVFTKYRNHIQDAPYENWISLSALPRNENILNQLEVLYGQTFREMVALNLDAKTYPFLHEKDFFYYINKENTPDYKTSYEIFQTIEHQNTDLNSLLFLVLNGYLLRGNNTPLISEAEFIQSLKIKLHQHSFKSFDMTTFSTLIKMVEQENLVKITNTYVDILIASSTEKNVQLTNLLVLAEIGLDLNKALAHNPDIQNLISTNTEALSYLILTDKVKKETLLHFLSKEELKKKATHYFLESTLEKREPINTTNYLQSIKIKI